MYRVIFVVMLVAGIWFLYRKYLSAPSRPQTPPAPAAAPRMCKCAHCGVHLPEAEALLQGGQAFCSEAHRLEYRQQHPSE